MLLVGLELTREAVCLDDLIKSVSQLTRFFEVDTKCILGFRNSHATLKCTYSLGDIATDNAERQLLRFLIIFVAS
jgi:hypothetical protein